MTSLGLVGRAGALVLVVLGVAAAPAAAMSPPPTRLTFDTQPVGTPVSALYPGSGLAFEVTPAQGPAGTPCTGTVIEEPPSGRHALRISCPAPQQPSLHVSFANVQYWVGLQVSPDSVPAVLNGYSLGDDFFRNGVREAAGPSPPRPGPWSPPLVIGSFGGAEVGGVRLQRFGSASSTMTIRSIAFSEMPQPTIAFTSTAPPVTADPTATFAFASTLPGPVWRCSLDGAPGQECSSPLTLTVPPGRHSLSVWLLSDDYLSSSGNDSVPGYGSLSTAWTVGPTASVPVDPPLPVNPFQPPGALIAGRTSNVARLSGTVLVHLPGRGAVPLANAASVPVGTAIDARKGRLRIDTAARFRGASGSQSATLGAGIFRARQRREGSGAATTDLALLTPAGAGQACAAGRAPPAKGIVRGLTGTAKGHFRALAGAARVTIHNATWTVQDTCRGTRVRITRGAAVVHDTARRRTEVLRAGGSYFAKARLFAARRPRGQRANLSAVRGGCRACPRLHRAVRLRPGWRFSPADRTERRWSVGPPRSSGSND